MITAFFLLVNLPGLGEVFLSPDSIALHSGASKVVAMSGDIVTVFDIETDQIHLSYKVGGPIQVSFIGERVVISSRFEKGLVFFNGWWDKEAKVLPGFFPRFVSVIGKDEVLGFPYMESLGAGTYTIPGWTAFLHKNEGLLSKVNIDFGSRKWKVGGNRIAPITKEQEYQMFNYKAFWALGNSKSFYLVRAVQNHVVLVNGMKEVKNIPIELPGWVPLTEPQFNSGTFSLDEYRKLYAKMGKEFSRILGAFLMSDGFVVCYFNPGQDSVKETRVAVYDSGWELISFHKVPGMLFGTSGNTGFFLSKWENGHQKVFLAELNTIHFGALEH